MFEWEPAVPRGNRQQLGRESGRQAWFHARVQVGEEINVLRGKWRPKQGREDSRLCDTGGAKASRNVFPSLASMVERD